MNYTLKTLRLAKGLTKKELADLAGVSRITIHNIENNDSIPKINNALKISKALGCPAAELFGKDAYVNYSQCI